jgi:putative heme-binding domain-containing protein
MRSLRRLERIGLPILILVVGPSHASLRATASAQVPSQSAEPNPYGQDRAPNPPRSPREAIAAMTVPPGFQVELVAGEPDIVNPVAMTFDERGRIWITESLEYPRREPGKGRDRVKVLEDTDGDGRADRFTVFADGLNIPSGIAVGHGGVWVANSPDLLFLQDRDGDGRADVREVVVTGFGRDDTHELPNSLTWGPDGWLYGWNGVFNPSKVALHNGKTYSFTCAIFRIHPKTRVFEIWCEGTSNPWGIAIDPEGSFFASACVIDHLWHLVETGYYIRQGGPYPPYTWPIGSIVAHKHQKAAYCGIHYFDSPAYPPQYRDRLYMGNIHGNCINVDVLETIGSTYRARPAPDFLHAHDAWFMPVSQKTGPDGCLYILDWYDRYHCYQDANRDPGGIDRLKGRLYRVRYNGTPRRVGFDLGKASDDDLIKLLASPNVYDRDIAQRLLTERASPVIRAKLESLVLDATAPRKARLHGLWALIGSGPLEPGFHVRLMNEHDPALLAWAVRAAGNQGRVEPAIQERLADLGRNSALEVRLQAAIAGRKLQAADPLPILLNALLYASDPLIPHVVWRNLQPLLEERQLDVARLLEELASLPADNPRRVNNPLKGVAPWAIERIMASPKADARVVRVLLRSIVRDEEMLEALDRVAERMREANPSPQLTKGLREELSRLLGRRVANAGDPVVVGIRIVLSYCGDLESLKAVLQIARTPCTNADPRLHEREALRFKAVQAVLYRRTPGLIRQLIEAILAEDESKSSLQFRGKVIAALDSLDDPEVAPILLRAMPIFPAQLKPRAIELLTERPIWARPLLAAISSKQIPQTALSVTQLRKLVQFKDPELARNVKALWGTIRDGRNPQREQVVDQMRRLIRATPGDPVAGQSVFNKLCAQCHKIYGEGQEVGPDITSDGRNDFEQLLSNVFDCNLVIGPGYQATTVATTDGRILSGLLSEDGRDRVVLRLQGGKLETIPRAQIDEMKTSAVSLMPDDVEKQLAPQEIADLFAFLCLDKPPADPTARGLRGAGPIVRRLK